MKSMEFKCASCKRTNVIDGKDELVRCFYCNAMNKLTFKEEDSEVRCPKCRSTQINASKKGFSGGKALIGGLLTGGIGLLAGTIGSSDVILICLNCGHKFNPPNKRY